MQPNSTGNTMGKTL